MAFWRSRSTALNHSETLMRALETLVTFMRMKQNMLSQYKGIYQHLSTCHVSFCLLFCLFVCLFVCFEVNQEFSVFTTLTYNKFKFCFFVCRWLWHWLAPPVSKSYGDANLSFKIFFVALWTKGSSTNFTSNN